MASSRLTIKLLARDFRRFQLAPLSFLFDGALLFGGLPPPVGAKARTADLTRIEFAEALETLHFQNADHKHAVKVDRDVAHYLARLLREREGRK